jgi:nonsense-mediated mRNA decay protein 3
MLPGVLAVARRSLAWCAQRLSLRSVQVARDADFGVNDCVFAGRTHLGGFLTAGDAALGYDLARFVTSDEHLDAAQQRGLQVPDFVLVRKDYAEARAKRRARRRPRAWKVKRLDMEAADENNFHAKRNRAPEAVAQAEAERFMEARPASATCAAVTTWLLLRVLLAMNSLR